MLAVFLMRKETKEDKIKMLLGLHTIILHPMGVAVVLLLSTVLTMAVILNLWFKGWWLTANSVFILMIVWITWYGGKYYNPIRKALGMEYVSGFGKHIPAEALPGKDEVQNLIAKTSPHLLMTVGLVAIGILLWLMRFKPFS